MHSPPPAPRLAALVLTALVLASLGNGRPAPTRSSPLGPLPPATSTAIPFHDCNANGVEDAVDIALGTSCDADLDGIPDECQALQDREPDECVCRDVWGTRNVLWRS